MLIVEGLVNTERLDMTKHIHVLCNLDFVIAPRNIGMPRKARLVEFVGDHAKGDMEDSGDRGFDYFPPESR